jgi:hypothetical protein
MFCLFHSWLTIFDNGITAPCSYPPDKFVAIGTPTTIIAGVGNAGPFHHGLFLPDRRIKLLSTAGHAPTRTLHCLMMARYSRFSFRMRILDVITDGIFWIGDDNAALTPSRAFTVAAPLSAALQYAAPISYTGAVHEFSPLHFHVGYLNYTAMQRALQAGALTSSQHSLKTTDLEQLPRLNLHLLLIDLFSAPLNSPGIQPSRLLTLAGRVLDLNGRTGA